MFPEKYTRPRCFCGWKIDVDQIERVQRVCEYRERESFC